MLKRLRRILMGLLRKLMSGQMIALAMRRCGGFMSVRGFVVELGGSIVRTLRHDCFSSTGWMPKLL
jgi:hypothetical protein